MATRIGIAGWRYAAWRGDFYPKGLPQRRELEYAAEHLTSIEVNGSFYSMQRPSSYAAWRAETPDDFVFSLKGPRFISHLKRLKDVEVSPSRPGSIRVPTIARRWSVASQSLACIPASTWPPDSQNAVNVRPPAALVSPRTTTSS